MPDNRLRCGNCNAALRKDPDIPESLEWFMYTEVEVECYAGDTFLYTQREVHPVRCTEEEAKAAERSWSNEVGPAWTCQRCKFENSVDDVVWPYDPYLEQFEE